MVDTHLQAHGDIADKHSVAQEKKKENVEVMNRTHEHRQDIQRDNGTMSNIYCVYIFKATHLVIYEFRHKFDDPIYIMFS